MIWDILNLYAIVEFGGFLKIMRRASFWQTGILSNAPSHACPRNSNPYKRWGYTLIYIDHSFFIQKLCQVSEHHDQEVDLIWNSTDVSKEGQMFIQVNT